MPLGRRVSINFKRFLLGIVDVCCIIFSCFSALFLQFDGNLPSIYLEKIFVLIIPIVIVDLLIFVIFKLYQSLWQFASVTELKNIIIACLIASLSNLLLSLVFNQYITTSFYFIYFLILIITVGGNRFCYQIIRLYTNKYNNQITKPVKDRVLIVGAGVAGEKIIFSNISRCFHLSVDLKDCKKTKQIKIHSDEWRFEYNSENKTGLFARNSWVSESEEIRLFNLESFENIEIWSDNSSLEIFINGGQDVLSSRIFPKTDVLSLCIEGADLYSSVQLNEILTA